VAPTSASRASAGGAPGSPSMSSTTSCARRRSRASTATRAPSTASPTASVRPIPCAAPVTTMTLPVTSISILAPFRSNSNGGVGSIAYLGGQPQRCGWNRVG
jgi:hypothetical protein